MENILHFETRANQDAYINALLKFERNGGRAELMERLLAIGLSAQVIRWHGEYPGRAMVTTCPE